MNIKTEFKSFLGQTLITKEKLNDPELSEARRQKCLICPMNKNDECAECGCPIASKILSKIHRDLFVLQLQETHCPYGKWPIRQSDGTIGGRDIEITNHYRKLKGKELIIINNK